MQEYKMSPEETAETASISSQEIAGIDGGARAFRGNLSIVLLCDILVFAAVSGLAGCQLALVDAGPGAGAGADKLIGIFITTEHLSLFDIEGYLSARLSGRSGGWFRSGGGGFAGSGGGFSGNGGFLGGDGGGFSGSGVSGGGLVVGGGLGPGRAQSLQRYTGRLYAATVTRVLTDETSGETTEIKEFVFEDIEGFAFFILEQPPIEGREGTTWAVSNDAVQAAHMHVHHGDTERRLSLEGTLYVVSAADTIFYFNPVFQNAAGDVYLTAGGGISVSGVQTEGGFFSQRIEVATTVSENGRTKTHSSSVEVAVRTMFAPREIIVLQMDGGGNLLERTVFAPGALPDVFEPRPGTAFLVIETVRRDPAGQTSVLREIEGRDSGGFGTFHARPDGVLISHWTQIQWPH